MNADDELPLLKMRFAPADGDGAIAFWLYCDSLPLPPRTTAIGSEGNKTRGKIHFGESMEGMYEDVLNLFLKGSEARWSPLMKDISARRTDGAGETYYQCVMCNKRMNQGHFVNSEIHCRRLQERHDVDRHQWDRESGYWVDVPRERW